MVENSLIFAIGIGIGIGIMVILEYFLNRDDDNSPVAVYTNQLDEVDNKIKLAVSHIAHGRVGAALSELDRIDSFLDSVSKTYKARIEKERNNAVRLLDLYGYYKANSNDVQRDPDPGV